MTDILRTGAIIWTARRPVNPKDQSNQGFMLIQHKAGHGDSGLKYDVPSAQRNFPVIPSER
jgi:hypothetical protein